MSTISRSRGGRLDSIRITSCATFVACYICSAYLARGFIRIIHARPSNGDSGRPKKKEPGESLRRAPVCRPCPVRLFAAAHKVEQEGEHVDEVEIERQRAHDHRLRSAEHTSELQSLMRISYAVFCLKKNTTPQ